MKSLVKNVMVVLAILSLFACEMGGSFDLESSKGVESQSRSVGIVPVTKAFELEDGKLQFQITLESGQAYVEVFARQNGLQNVAANIVNSEVVNADGTSTYSFVQSGYQKNDKVEFRFYHFLPGKAGVFTPGPYEGVWETKIYGAKMIKTLDVMKDTHIKKKSYVADNVYIRYNNYGDVEELELNSPTTGFGYYYSRILTGFDLSSIPADGQVTKAMLNLGEYKFFTGYIYLHLAQVLESSSWSEDSVTYMTEPETLHYNTYQIFMDYDTYKPDTLQLDVTELVNAAIAAGQSEVSFRLGSGDYVKFNSKESTATEGMSLTVEYN